MEAKKICAVFYVVIMKESYLIEKGILLYVVRYKDFR